MSVRENKALMLRVFQEMNMGKEAAMSVIDESCTSDFVFTAAEAKRYAVSKTSNAITPTSSMRFQTLVLQLMTSSPKETRWRRVGQ